MSNKQRGTTLPNKKLKLKDTKITAMQDENGELHPLLEKLLWKLPGIIDLEYKQGTNEKGADFVLRKEDEMFGGQEFIGIVAKIGSIHQSLTKVQEQIEECFTLDRFVKNGKEKIFIQEVWVVFTGGTTPNAEEKIHSKFHSHKIRFIDGKHLEKLVNQYVPYYWDEVPLEIGLYLKDVLTQVNEFEKRASLMTDPTSSDDIYVEPEITTYPTNNYDKRVRRIAKRSSKVDLIAEIANHRILFIEGDMGVGKSKLIRRLASQFSDPKNFNNTNTLPIPMSFRDLVNEFQGSFEKLVKAKISEKLKNELEEKTQYLILVDGMDEKNLTTAEQLEYLDLLISGVDLCKNVKLVLTSRPLKAFDEYIRLKSGVNSYVLNPLSFNKSLQLIQKVCLKLNMADRIVEDLKKSSLFKELPKNPIAVILLANLLNENRQEIPSNLTELYSKYMELALGRWDISKGLRQQKEYEALQRVIMRLSTFIVDNDLRFVSIDEVKGFFIEYLKERNLHLNEDDLFDLLINRTELMLLSPDERSVAFKHKTFAEFLYAKQARENGKFIVDDRAFQPYWLNTYFFYLGLTKDAEGLLESLLGVELKREVNGFMRVMHMGGFLLAAYLTPYSTVKKAVHQIAIEAAILYQEIVANKTELVFSRFSRIHCIWVFQMILRQTYGYDFFLPAIEDAALKIADTEKDPTTKAYAIFFLSVIYMEITKDKTFQFLLDNIDDLPVDISIAYLNETDNVTKRTEMMKRMDRKIRRSLRGGGRESQKALEKLLNTPIINT